MKEYTQKQIELLLFLSPEIREYREAKEQADNISVNSYKDAEVARYWQARASDRLSEIEFWVRDAYMKIPFRSTRNACVERFMEIVTGD